MPVAPRKPWVPVPERELTQDERAILRHILNAEAPALLEDVDRLRVVGKCSCGGCPTVIFFDRPLRPYSRTELRTYMGKTISGGLTGVVVQLIDGKIFELEGWSLDTKDSPVPWPILSTMTSMRST